MADVFVFQTVDNSIETNLTFKVGLVPMETTFTLDLDQILQ